MADTLLVCDCMNSQHIDRDSIAAGAGVVCSRVYSALCTTEGDAVAEALRQGSTIIACRQEWARFEEIAAEADTAMPLLVDIRDRAGWSDEAGQAGAKQAALVAEACLPAHQTAAVDVVSDGRCLILGAPAPALAAAAQLADMLSVTVLSEELPDELAVDRRFDVVIGRLVRAQGAFGGFRVQIDGMRQLVPGGRGAWQFTEPRDGAESTCDVILDISGRPPRFPADSTREGYLRADPGDREAVAAKIFEASQMVGTFEKPLYVRLEATLCAHSRAGQVGCTKCLDACPTGALAPDGDYVAVDPMVCAGCGACSALCPSGAISYDAPAPSALFRRLDTLARAYRDAGGTAPRLLVVDTTFGTEMIALVARYGRGLPADVVPLELGALAAFGHAEMLAALACGFVSVDILLAPKSERDVLAGEVALAVAMGTDGRLRLLDLADPDELGAMLYGRPVLPLACEPVLPLGSRRQVARLAAKALHPGRDAVLPLPVGAPYGAVVVDDESCTLCLACASLCPTGALGDNPDMPQLRFQEDACLQCGLCRQVCPENAVSLVPQMTLSDSAFSERVLKEEPPFPCIECGKPFGVKSAIEKIAARLEGHHSMFPDSKTGRLIRMCNDCRVQAQFHAENNPFAGAVRPRVRTTDDYLGDDDDH